MRGRRLFVLATSLAACNGGDHRIETSTDSTRRLDTVQQAVLADTLIHADPETLAIAPKDPATTDQIARIEPFRARLDSLLDTRSAEVHFFARLGKDDQNECIEPIDSVVAVSDPEKWPSNTQTSLIVVVEQRRVLAVREVPVSCSGDWSNSYTHTFDTTGRAVSFERFSGFFNGCPGTAHEISTYYFAPTTGSLLGKRYSMTHPDGKAFSPSECQEFDYQYPYTIYSNWPAAARALHLPVVIPSGSKGAKETTSQSQNALTDAKPRFACLSPDSGILAYGTILVDSGETGDASGVQYSFKMERDSLRGFVRDAAGEIPPAMPLKDLEVFANGDSIRFWYGDEQNQSFHRYQFGCDQLTGTSQPFATPNRRGRTYVDTVRRAIPITSP